MPSANPSSAPICRWTPCFGAAASRASAFWETGPER